MSLMTIAIAALSATSLSAVCLSFFALFHGRAMAQGVEAQAAAALRAMESNVAGLAEQVQDLHREGAAAPRAASSSVSVPSLPRFGMNVSKRAEALRLHRRGETAEQIARALETPVQEIELLLKVHALVIRNL